MNIIYTKKGEEISVDDHNYDHLNKEIWYLDVGGYAVRKGNNSDGERKGKMIWMHREIIGAKTGEIVDHIDRKRTNNLESNLRICNFIQNMANSIRSQNNKSSIYKGVSKTKSGTFAMEISNEGERVRLFFDDEILAAAAYDYYAKNMFGEFAYLNEIDIPKEIWIQGISNKHNNRSKGTSQYKGVYWNERLSKWITNVRDENKNSLYVGSYKTEEEAAVAYNIIILDRYGEDAEINIIENNSQVFIFTIRRRPLSKSNMYGARAIGKRAIIYTTKEMEDFQIKIGQTVQQLIPKTLTGFHCIYVRCYSTETKLYDIDNPLKAILDSVDNTKKIKRGTKEIFVCENSGIDNDKNFQLVISERVFVEDKDQEKIEVIIAPYEGLLPFVKLILKEYGEE